MNTEINHIISAEEMPKYALVCLNEKGLWIKADASTLVRMPALGLTLNAPRVGFSGNVLMLGIVNNNEWSWTVNTPIYVSPTGYLTQVKPTGYIIQIIAYATSPTEIYFNPQKISETTGGGGEGSVWYDGSGAPGGGLGEDGDYYLDTDNGDIYTKSGVWGKTGNIKGPQGSQGAQGIQGEQGSQGIQGIPGEQGLKGDTGDAGPKGDTGDMGPQGIQGEQGTQGIQGTQGEPGLKGDKGDSGDEGPKGDTGDQGIQGEPGVKGDTGDPGPKGDQGDTGPNEVTVNTDTSITGILKGASGKVAQALGGTDYANVSHGHPQSDVTNLVSDLSSKETPAGAQGKVDTHAALTTGVHGVGGGTVAKTSDIAQDSNLSSNAQDAISKRHTQNSDTDLDSTFEATFEKVANKGAASGYAPLDASSKVPVVNLGGAGADSSKYLRGDQSWQTPPSGGGGVSQVPTYSWNSGGIAITAINTLLMDLFNASGSGKTIKIFQIEVYQRNSGSITGVSICLEAYRTTDVGTGGTMRTADKMDTTDPDIPAQITFRTSPTGGATPTGNPIAVGNIYTEEGANNQSQIPMYENSGAGIRNRLTLREGEGIRIVTGPWGTAGTIALRIAAEVS